MATKKSKHTAEEAAKVQISENGATLGQFLEAFMKLPPEPKKGPKKVGPKKKPGRKPKAT